MKKILIKKNKQAGLHQMDRLFNLDENGKWPVVIATEDGKTIVAGGVGPKGPIETV